MARSFSEVDLQLVPLAQDILQRKRRFDRLLQRMEGEVKNPPRAAISTLLVADSPRGKYRVQAVPAFVPARRSAVCRRATPAHFDQRAWAVNPTPPESSDA